MTSPEPIVAPPEPLLRTLAPLLRNLEKDLRGWLDGPHRFPLSMIARASLEGMTNDLRRQAEALDMERPMLVIMLMGGTGVGKSTLLNALAGAPIAQSSFTRPTTRDPVVYYHHSIRSDRLDPALRHCRLAQHDREALAQKILVDTPDLDSNDIANREKLIALLPVADIVLYVGSQEKYHDKLGWELFKEQRKRRAFAFVLNKWDRCLRAGESGLRPDEDLLRDLKAEGFENPQLFRTMAQSWLDAAASQTTTGERGVPTDLPEGEQFGALVHWLELGLTRLEVEAVKARGVGQLLGQISQTIQGMRPPDLTAEATRTQAVWERILHEESQVHGDVLSNTLEPYQREIEHHFSVEGQKQFRGLMAGYLRLTSRVRHAGSTLRDRVPFVPKFTSTDKVVPPSTWNLSSFAHECTRVAGEKALDKRGGAIVNRLLVDADRQGFPLQLLNNPTTAASRIDWHQRYDRSLLEALAEVERACIQPKGYRRAVQLTLVSLANFLPEAVFLGSLIRLLYQFMVVEQFQPNLMAIALPFLFTFSTLLLLQILIALLLPWRWAAVRGEFHTQLVERIHSELARVYLPIPEELAKQFLQERDQLDRLAEDVQKVLNWLEERQVAANIAGLYGN